jgi:hypothetical protein
VNITGLLEKDLSFKFSVSTLKTETKVNFKLGFRADQCKDLDGVISTLRYEVASALTSPVSSSNVVVKVDANAESFKISKSDILAKFTGGPTLCKPYLTPTLVESGLPEGVTFNSGDLLVERKASSLNNKDVSIKASYLKNGNDFAECS